MINRVTKGSQLPRSSGENTVEQRWFFLMVQGWRRSYRGSDFELEIQRVHAAEGVGRHGEAPRDPHGLPTKKFTKLEWRTIGDHKPGRET